jgi:hypothetical protein
MRPESGQASLEWVGLVLLASLAFGGLVLLVPRTDGRSVGGFLAHRILCAVRGRCDDGDAALARVYGPHDAALAREWAPGLVYEPGEPSLPVDYRSCRRHACADAPDDPDLDAHYSRSGRQATVFTQRWRSQGRLYLAYWLYYPDSNTTVLHSDWVWNHSPLRLVHGYPGFHLDDWEVAVVRIDPDGSVWARASSHGHWQACKWAQCRNRWVRWSGWSRVSRGSHAGHIPGRLTRSARLRFRPSLPGVDLHERTSTAEGLRLVPLESLNWGAYRRLGEDVDPPWEKETWADLEHGRP